MVLFSLLELTAQAGFFVVKKTWHVGSYLIWGHQKTREEILEEKLEKQIERENELLEKLNGLHQEITEVRELKSTTTTQNAQNVGQESESRRKSI